VLLNGLDLLKGRIGKGRKNFRFAGREPSCLVRLQHQLQPPLNEFIGAAIGKGLKTFAVSPMAIDRRVSADKPKMMDETKGFVAETEALQHVQKPDGLFGIHALLGG
jgi:hypothetical protein